MLRVLFFARIREQLDCAALEVPWGEGVASLDALQAHLEAGQGQLWADVLGQDNIIRAVNQDVIGDNCALADGDEVAFFPPVTGG